MTNTPRPIQRQAIRRTLEGVEKKQKDVMTVTDAFDDFKEAWDVTGMGQKDLLALHESARKKPRSGGSYFLLRINK